MNTKGPITVFDIAKHFCLAIEYCDDLPEAACGFLAPSDEPTLIVVNAKHPKCEQAFTVAHELGHYIKHYNCTPMRMVPFYLNRTWKSDRMKHLVKIIERVCARKFNAEWQADLWALCLLFRLGAKDDLQAWIKRHPEKTGVFFVAATACASANLKALPARIFCAVTQPSQTA